MSNRNNEPLIYGYTRRGALRLAAGAALILAGCAPYDQVNIDIPRNEPDVTEPPTTDPPVRTTEPYRPPATTTTTINERRILQDQVRVNVNAIASTINLLADPNLPNQKVQVPSKENSYAQLITKFAAREDGLLDRYRAKAVYNPEEPFDVDTAEVASVRLEIDTVPGIGEPEIPRSDAYIEFVQIAERNWHLKERVAGGPEMLFTTQDLSTIMTPKLALTEEQIFYSVQTGLQTLTMMQSLEGVPIQP